MSHGSILVLSNRLPFTLERTAGGLQRRPSTGGLVSALDPVLAKQGGTWVGWPGTTLKHGETIDPDAGPYRVRAVDLTERDVARFYHGFSNRTLWPLFHAFTERTQFDPAAWKTYQRVNGLFAAAALQDVDGADLVWVHDYHLMLTPALIQNAAPQARLAFFLHIPFPPHDIFRLLPWDRELLVGLMSCRLVGFHVRGYAQNFLDCVERRLGARVDRDAMLIEYGERTVQVGAFPIGIDYTRFEENAQKHDQPSIKGAERIVLGVDRLDYTKGIPERIRAFARLLELYPEHHEKVVFIQVAVPSRSQVQEYKDLKREIDELVGQINGRFATAAWTPVRYLYRAFPQAELAAMYRDADVAMVTPLRDGMNLVAKEYVACQTEDPGVLILSRLAGAGETMHEALLVNPYNYDEAAGALHRALHMDITERRSRMTALRRRERANDLDAWVQDFFEAASADPVALRLPSEDDFDRWLSKFLGHYRLALFLDYDGTLTPLVDHPDKAHLSEEVHVVLKQCAERPDTDIAIISGRALQNVKDFVDVPELTYVGNHGLEVVGPQLPHFRHEDLAYYAERTAQLAETLQTVAVHGAWVEKKGPTLTFHYRAVPDAQQADIAESARQIISDAGYQPRDAHAAVEARPPIGWDKGRAVLHVLRGLYGPAWSEKVRVIYAGDDETDEDAFRFLAGLAITFRVGGADILTSASRTLPDVAAIRALLSWLANRPATDR